MIGFTKDETQKILKDYELDDFSQTVKNYYDGYKFYDKEMFCPWDVINFISKNFSLNKQVTQMTLNLATTGIKAHLTVP